MVNLWPNSSFEDSVAPWTANRGADEPIVDHSRAHSGSASMHTRRGAGTAQAYTVTPQLHDYLTPGISDFVLVAWVWVPASTAGDVGFQFAGTGVLGTTAQRRVFATTRDAWEQLTATFTWDGNGTVRIDCLGTDPSAEMWIDDFTLDDGTEPPAPPPRQVGTYLVVDGTRYADTAADYAAGTPTALADLELSWGRSTAIDQPEAATSTVTVLDRSGSASFFETLEVGKPFEVWATADVSPRGENVFTDPSFEALPLGEVFSTGDTRFRRGTVNVIEDAYDGIRAVSWEAGDRMIAPAGFSDDVGAWEGIPVATAGETWTVRGHARTSGDADPTIALCGWPSSQRADPVVETSRMDLLGPHDGDWHPFEFSWQLTDEAWTGTWVGVRVWNGFAGVRMPIALDLVEVIPPDTLQQQRDVLVLAGRISDLSVASDSANPTTMVIKVTAVDQFADLENTYIGDKPWDQQQFKNRIATILAAAGLDIPVTIDSPYGPFDVFARDVDRQPVGGLLRGMAEGVAGILWSATHPTIGPYLWIENPNHRAPAAETVLDGCILDLGSLTWQRNNADVITRVDLDWENPSQQTSGTVTALDTAGELIYGSRRLGAQTPILQQAMQQIVADSYLARSRRPSWRTEGLTYDLALFPPTSRDQANTALDLLDGTIRIGRALAITNADLWPGALGGMNFWPNTGFETNAAPFVANAGSNNPQRWTNISHSGNACMRASRGNGTSSVFARAPAEGFLPRAGDYTLTAWVWVPEAVTGGCGIQISGTGTGTARRLATTRDAWEQLTATFTWDGNGTVRIDCYGVDQNAQLRVDDLYVRSAPINTPVVNAYLDGGRYIYSPDGWALGLITTPSLAAPIPDDVTVETDDIEAADDVTTTAIMNGDTPDE